MQFGLSESQEFLKDSARKFFAGECPSNEMRRVMETDTGFDAALWAKLTNQGYTGIIFPEEYGGVGLGKVELMLLMEEAGRVLLPGPFFSTVVLAGSVLDAVGTPEHKKKYLEPICKGEVRSTVAILEAGASWNPRDVQLSATNGKLTGEKLFVSDAAVADFLIVVARNGVFVVESKAPGLKISPMSSMDLTRKLYVVEFSNTPAEEIGPAANLSRAVDVATAALAAELVGGMQRTLDITVEYAKTRKQFGKPIGIFQAVQHQCADMYLETESSRSAVYYAGWALEENAPDAATAVSIAKMYSSDAARTVSNRGIQIHGGMGFTWENDLHLYYRRAKASETAFGDATFHRERIASMVIDSGSLSRKGAQSTSTQQESPSMTDLVQLASDNGIAVITINNPPVNALSPGVPEGISEALDKIAHDDSVKATVLIGSGRTFVAGADIKEFGKITSGKTRGAGLLPLLLKIEDSAKPVIVAIHGTAFGGGMELAMAGHYRVALATAQFGQPEVKLGLIPGAAGTQRLPRLAGVEKAVEMCVSGNPVKAEEALKLGIVDRIIEGDLLGGAVALAREVADKPAPKTRERNEKLGNAAENALIFSTARETAAKKQRGLLAPSRAIDAVEAAARLSFEEGCKAEQKFFIECLFSEQSKSLIHVFFSEREIAKIPDIPRQTNIIPIHSAAVVGAGTMGGGIAMVLANAGIPVLLKEADQSALDRGVATIQSNYANSVKRGRFSSQVAEQRLKRITPTLAYDDFSGVDLVIEAVFESMALKKEVFQELDRVCKPGAILASNTSTLSIDEIASATSRPESVIGTHFFSPANVMRLLEIVRGKSSSKEVVATCMQLSKTLGKVGVLVGNCRGFVGNRMFGPYRREAQFLIEEGAGVEAVDQALCDFGMAMGPLATGDLAGLDVGWRIRKEYRHLEGPGVRQPFAEDRLCELGRYGQKTGAGWYKYDDQRRATPDPAVDELIRKWVEEAGIVQRQISAAEITDRCLYALVNEGARILEEGFALRASDIDIIYINGYGFPAHRGGPLWYADTVGLERVYDRICEFHSQRGEIWQPAPLLKQLAEQGKTFAAFGREQGATA